ncbi:hypothetical protein D9M72_580980 [compost metagenome]
MQRQVRRFALQQRPLALGFLHAVFAKHALAGRNHRTDRVGVECLGDGNEADGMLRALCRLLRRMNPAHDILQPLLNFHGPILQHDDLADGDLAD